MPTFDLTITLSNAVVTSRLFGNGLSEALLLIDEPGAAPGAGAGLPFNLCSGGALGAAPGGCATTVQTLMVGGYTTTVASTDANATAASVPNAFQGLVNANQVVFHGVPLLAPVTSGYARVFRITNIRVDATSAGAPGQILAGVTASNGVPLLSSVMTVANVFAGIGASSARNASNSGAASTIALSQCSSSALTPGAVLRFSEDFAQVFRTRVSPTSTVSGAATPPGSTTTVTTFGQNVPGLLYGGSESTFIAPVLGGTAGLSDFGTRLKATFYNVPPGVGIYVSTTNINPLGNAGVNPSAGANLTAPATAVAAGNFARVASVTSFLAGLVTGETAAAASGGALPLASATTTSGGVALYGPLPVDANGTAAAAWEVLLSNPGAVETAEFAVFYTSTNPSVTAMPASVALSFAPAFATAGGGTVLPRFVPAAAGTNLLSVAACQSSSVGLVSSAVSSTFGQPVTFTATISATGGTPTGTVAFKDGATTLRTVTLSGGQAAYTTSSLPAGSHIMTAVYSGDSSFGGMTSGVVTQLVNRAPTATALSVSGTFTNGRSAALAATVTSSAGTPTGVVTFRYDGGIAGQVAVDGSGQARLSTGTLSMGDHVLTATYEGNTNFAASASAAQHYSVARNETSVSMPAIRSGAPVQGEVLTIAATVEGDGSFVSGTLTFRDGPAVIGEAAIDATGTGVITIKPALGLHPITALYNGDPWNAVSISPTLYLMIRGTPAVALTSSANPAAAGASLIFTATVTPPPGATAGASGAVTFTDGATTLGTARLASGQASVTVAAGLAAGDHNIVASYAGDAAYVPAQSAALLQRVNKTATATTLSEAAGADGFSLSAAVTPATPGALTGTIEFLDVTAGATLGAAPAGNNAATLRLAAPLPIGHVLKAAYGGDSVFAASESSPQPFLAVANGFSFAPRFAPDAVVSVFGSGFSSAATSATAPLPTTLAGVSVTIVDADGGAHAGLLYYVSPSQINFVAPSDAPAGPARITITGPGGALSIAATISRSAPALTSADGSGSGTAAAQLVRVHREGGQEPPVAVTDAPIPHGGDGDRLYLTLYGTGLRHSSAPVECFLNGQSVPVLFAGAQGAWPGLDQINLELPRSLSGAVRVSCTADGVASNVVSIAVQ